MTTTTPDYRANLLEGYHAFLDPETSEEHGSFEVFWYDGARCSNDHCWDCALLDGWYWWPCFPGCLPESDPIGPFDTSADAYADAQGE